MVSGAAPSPSLSALPRSTTDSIRIVAYLELFRLATADMVRYPRARLFCLGRGPEEPEDSPLVQRVRRVEPRASPLAACVTAHPSSPNDPSALRPSPQQYVVWLHAGEPISADTIAMVGGYYAGGLLSAKWQCNVVRESGVWRVVGDCRASVVS